MIDLSASNPFPAPAGMNRRRKTGLPIKRTVPRARGDEPLALLMRTPLYNRSPRPRG